MTENPFIDDIPISVDIETAGPNPGTYSLLSIGACTIFGEFETFYIELQPINQTILPEAQAIHELSLEVLSQVGVPPSEAMARFADWLNRAVPDGRRPVFLAFNAPFDWMFVNDYFHRYLGHNPFGHTALDIKALFMGMTGCPWRDTSMALIASRYMEARPLIHHALQDALDQADLFRHIFREFQARKESNPQS